MILGIDASRSFGPRPTGTEHYASQVTRGIVRRGRHRCRLYCRQMPIDPPDGAEIRLLPARRLWTHRRLASELRRHPPDLLFVPAHVLPLPCPVPAVVTVHDLGYEHFPAAHPLTRRLYLRWSTRRHARIAAGILADSAATRDDLVALYGARPERIRVVHLAADEIFRPAGPAEVAAIRARLGLPADARYLLHVGTLQPRKNLGRLLRAFSSIAPEDPELHLVLAGMPGWGGSDWAGDLERLGLSDRIHLPGYLPREQLPALYSGALALVLPSLFEGFGLPVLEAMACGTPVACADRSSLPEVAGDAALLFDPLDEAAIAAALRRLRDEAGLRRSLAQAGLLRAAEFSWQRCADETLDWLETVAAARDPGLVHEGGAGNRDR